MTALMVREPVADEQDDDILAGLLRTFMDRVEVSPGAPAAVCSLSDGDCRWPIGDPAEPSFRYCCEPAVPGARPRYCPVHAALHKG